MTDVQAKPQTFFIRERSLLVSGFDTQVYLMREEAVIMAIKAASLSACRGNHSRVIMQDGDQNGRVFWSSKLRNPAGAAHRKRL